ncbi:MAG: penicillin acylase family protein, partial [Acidobacteria bacterium]|nr:penicillin acylase family protein [Acidobacteriota bacterium]
MGRCIAALLAIFCALGNDPARARPEAVSAATLEEQVEILRDPQGVAHVFAPTDEGVFYGAGYAAAEDRLLQMDYAPRVLQGRLTEVLGARALDSDRLMRTLGLYLHAQEIIHHLDEDVQISATSPPLWYEIHLSGKTYRVRGLGVAGCPGILIGWNDHVAWG